MGRKTKAGAINQEDSQKDTGTEAERERWRAGACGPGCHRLILLSPGDQGWSGQQSEATFIKKEEVMCDGIHL